MILSQLHFSILIWGFSLEKIIKLQKRAIRVISNSKYNSHTEPLFKKLKLLKLTDIFNCQQIKFYHKYLNNKLPEYFTDIFTRLNNSTQNYSTRNRDNISFEKVKHEYAKKRIRYCIPNTLNNCPDLIKHKLYTHSIEGLSSYMKRHHFSNWILTSCPFYIIWEVLLAVHVDIWPHEELIYL